MVTYRHLVANITPNNPLRVIAHCDIDAAYAQFEVSRLNLPRDQPVAVQQWQGLIAINYPARAYGITRHMRIDEAKKKCPSLICVHVATYKVGGSHDAVDAEVGYWDDARPETHKVSLDPYRRESLKILKIFSAHCPTIEKASIDEAFLDLSLPVRQMLLDRYPQLNVETHEDALDDPLPPVPSDWSWEGRGNVIRKNSLLEKKKGSESTSTQSVRADMPVDEPSDIFTWTDIALGLGAEIMQNCRKAVFDELGYTCSAGIAQNKLLSKLCSGWKKPNEQTILPPSVTPDFLRPLNFQKLRSLGGKRGEEVANEFDVATVGDVWTISLDELQRKFGDEGGMWIWEVVRGIDLSEVTPKVQTKSMLSSKNMRPYITTWDEAVHWLKVLSAELHARLTESISLSPGLWPKTLTLHCRNASYTTKSKQIPFPFTSHLTTEYILKHAERLMKEFTGEKKKETQDGIGKITNLSLAFHGLESLESGQKGIEGFFGIVTERKQESSLVKVQKEDRIQKSTTASPSPHKRKLDVEDISPRRKWKKGDIKRPQFTCSTCGKRVEIPTSVLSDDIIGDSEAVDKALAIVRAEHEDYHLAKKLHEEEFQRGREEDAVVEMKKKKKRKEEDNAGKTKRKKGKTEEQTNLMGFFKKV